MPLSAEEFRNLYLAYLKKTAPGLSVELVGDLEFRVKEGENASHSVFLDNAYQQYLGDPEKRDEIIETYIGSFLEVIGEREKEVDVNRIVPVIKDHGWLEDIQESLEARGGGEEPLPNYLRDSYNSELAIFYAEDSERNIRYLTEEAIEGLGIERESLRELAVENLRRLLVNIEVMGGDGVYMITAGGDYEASLLLVDSIWNPESMPVSGEFVAAIPSRGVLLVTGSGNRDAIENLREMVGETGGQLSYRLTPVLFVRRGGSFEVLEG